MTSFFKENGLFLLSTILLVALITSASYLQDSRQPVAPQPASSQTSAASNLFGQPTTAGVEQAVKTPAATSAQVQPPVPQHRLHFEDEGDDN